MSTDPQRKGRPTADGEPRKRYNYSLPPSLVQRFQELVLQGSSPEKPPNYSEAVAAALRLWIKSQERRQR